MDLPKRFVFTNDVNNDMGLDLFIKELEADHIQEIKEFIEDAISDMGYELNDLTYEEKLKELERQGIKFCIEHEVKENEFITKIHVMHELGEVFSEIKKGL